MRVLLEGTLDQLPVISLLTTIATHHNTMITSQINTSDFGVIKTLARTPDVGTCVDRSLRRVEFLLRLG
jgi:hypothetical protein